MIRCNEVCKSFSGKTVLVISVLLTRLAEKSENRKMQEALDKYNGRE